MCVSARAPRVNRKNTSNGSNRPGAAFRLDTHIPSSRKAIVRDSSIGVTLGPMNRVVRGSCHFMVAEKHITHFIIVLVAHESHLLMRCDRLDWRTRQTTPQPRGNTLTQFHQNFSQSMRGAGRMYACDLYHGRSVAIFHAEYPVHIK